MNQEKKHILKQISGWHYIYVIIILILIIVGLLSYKYSNNDSLVALISFAATISSIILSVLAIFMTVLSGESMNKLRNSLVGLTSIPGDVKSAISSTIMDMKHSSEELNKATEVSNENIRKFNQAVDDKMSKFESHILKQLDLHQESTLRAINESSLTNRQEAGMNGENISDDIIDKFVSSTSNACVEFMYVIGEYCTKINKSKPNYPIVNLEDVTSVINGGKTDSSFNMYLFACVIILSSFGLLDYDMQEGQFVEVKFKSINQKLFAKIPDEITKRNLKTSKESLNQFVESLFNIKVMEDSSDGSEAY